MNSDTPARRAIKVPFGVRWREFRIELLPLFAFVSVLAAAGLLWKTAVLPLRVEPGAHPVVVLETVPEPEPLVNASLDDVTHNATNGIARGPEARQ